MKIPEPLCFQSRVVGRLYQTPTDDLFIAGKTFLVWPLFPVRDKTNSHWIFSNVVRELIPMFEGDDQSRLAAIAILRANHMVR